MFSWTSTLVKTPTLHCTHPWVLDALAPQNVWRYFVTSPLRREQIFGGKASDKAWTAVLSHTRSTRAGFRAAIRELFARTRQLGSLCPARTPLNTDNSSYLAVVASQGLGWGGSGWALLLMTHFWCLTACWPLQNQHAFTQRRLRADVSNELDNPVCFRLVLHTPHTHKAG